MSGQGENSDKIRPIRFLNTYLFWRNLPHQVEAIKKLDDLIRQKYPELISPEQEWVKTWRKEWNNSTSNSVTEEKTQLAVLAQKIIAAVPNDRIWNGKTRRENAAVAVPLLLSESFRYQVGNPHHLAYILGTVSHESGFAAIEEIGNRSYFFRYENRRDLGNFFPGDGFRFRGRGYVQITGRANYERFGSLLGIDLVSNPDLALDPAISARITVFGMARGLFTGRKLSDYDLPDGGYDYVNARRIVNHLDRAELIAGYARYYYSVLTAETQF